MNWSYLSQTNEPISVSQDQLSAMALCGELVPESLVWNETLPEWQPARNFWTVLTGSPAPPPMPVASPVRQQPRMVNQPMANYRVGQPKRSGCGCVGRIALGVVVGLFALMAFSVYQSRNNPSKPSNASESARSRFREANRLIDNSRDGAGQGDHRDEKSAAAMMASLAAQFRKEAISKGSGSTRGIFGYAAKAADSNGFTAFCKRKGDTVLFLLHVPDLRHFEEKAKRGMAEGAWVAANFATEMLDDPKPTRMVVATRGIVLYDTMLEGTVKEGFLTEGDNEDDKKLHEELGIDSISSDEDSMKEKFYTFFEPVEKPIKVPAKQPAATTPEAKRPEQ